MGAFFVIVIIATICFSVWAALASSKTIERNSEKFRQKADGKPFCPICGCTDLSANNKGFSMVTGTIGSKDVYITCIKCGHRWKAGQYRHLYKD